MSEKIELLSCPFCGGDAVFRYLGQRNSKQLEGFDTWGAGCGRSSCAIGHTTTGYEYTQKEAARKWNTRAQPNPAKGETGVAFPGGIETNTAGYESIYEKQIEELKGKLASAVGVIEKLTESVEECAVLLAEVHFRWNEPKILNTALDAEDEEITFGAMARMYDDQAKEIRADWLKQNGLDVGGKENGKT